MRFMFFSMLAFLAILVGADQLLNHGQYTRMVVGFVTQ